MARNSITEVTPVQSGLEEKKCETKQSLRQSAMVQREVCFLPGTETVQSRNKMTMDFRN